MDTISRIKEAPSMKRFPGKRSILPLLILSLALGGVFPAPAETANGKVTVMVYMCGSDLEGRGRQGSQAISQMLSSGFDPEEVSVVLLLGGSVSWKMGYDPGELTLLQLNGPEPAVIDTLPLSPMSEPETLSAFLTLCREKYPADTYILDIWDHGGGPIYGVCQDALFRNDLLFAAELVDALEASPFAEGGLDLMVLNCCLMASAEFCAMLSPFARYLVATEDSMFGLSYDWLAGVENDPGVLDTAIRIADASFSLNEEIIARQHASEINSFAVVDLGKMPAVADAADDFFSRVSAGLEAGLFSSLSDRRGNAAAFGLGSGDESTGFDLVDLGDLARRYSEADPEGAEALLTAIEDAAVYRKSALDTCTGLTVFHPYGNKARLTERMGIYNTLSFSEAYVAYVQQFAACLTGTPLAQWTDLKTGIRPAVKDQRTLFTLPLTDDQARHFGGAELYVLIKDGEDAYAFAAMNGHTALENGRVTGEFVRAALYAADGEGNLLSGELAYSVDSRGYYHIPALLSMRDGRDTVEETACQAVISCAYDPDTKELSPGGVAVWEETLGGYTTAYNTVFADYDEIRIVTPLRRETRDESGALLPFDQWEIVNTREWSFPIDGSWRFVLNGDSLDLTRLYATFQVADSQRNTYSSELMPVKAAASDAAMRTDYDDAGLALISGLALTSGAEEWLLSLRVVNLTEREAIIRLENLTVGGVPVDGQAEAYGSGENWGLLTGEEQSLALPIAAAALPDEPAEWTFDLRVMDAASEETIGVVPVTVTLGLE